jgi:hypothetical protein
MALQEKLLDLDTGTTARFLKIGMISAFLIGLCLVYTIVQFKGLGSEMAMDQAQIARSLMSGEGFSTRYIRPLAIRQLSDTGRKIPSGNFPDFYNAPLYPLVESLALLPVKKHLAMTPTETLGAGDRAVAILGVILLLTGVLVWYFVARLIFDHSLAILSAGLILVTDLMWQFALAGLPQHLLIILFGIVTYCALKASRANEEENDLQVFLWLGGAGLGLGLMSLTNGVTAFFVPGFLVFCLVGFDARIRAFLVPLFAYFLCVTPWLIRNTMVCGNPLGLSVYTALAGAGVTESSIMRGVSTGLIFGGGMATKFRSGIMDQAAHLWEYFGLNLAVIAFVVSVLHPFRSSFASLWRWIILLMWVGAIIGMTLFGVSGAVSGNQLHAVFLPTFIIYGLAFVLVLWNRLEISFKPLRIAFLTLIFFISGTPMLLTLLAGQTARIQWPPYVPPFIAILQNWFQKDEILCSDMPWAVAWYADRKCLLLPETVKAFDEISDYSTLGSAIVGLYLTPISGRDDFLSLVKGTNKEWGPVIMRTVNLNEFLLKSFTPLPIDGECILYADTERWARKTIK